MVGPATQIRTHTKEDRRVRLWRCPIRILIVDDILEWHCIYTTILRWHPSWEIVGAARDFVEAIRKSRKLKPDVVLLDVGLGRMDCSEAIRKISEVSPASRVLFLGVAEPSQLVETVRSTGAYGYISKRNVVLELVPALEAVAEARRFLGRGVS